MAAKLRLCSSDKIVSDTFDAKNDVTVYHGDCHKLLDQIPNGAVQLVVTSPPYNIGKRYERRVDLSDYVRREEKVIHACIDRLAPGGSICWQMHTSG